MEVPRAMQTFSESGLRAAGLKAKYGYTSPRCRLWPDCGFLYGYAS